MRLDLLGRILINGYRAEIRAVFYELLLILKADHYLFQFVGEIIREDGFKFR
jgi:hypothetical protein